MDNVNLEVIGHTFYVGSLQHSGQWNIHSLGLSTTGLSRLIMQVL